MREVFYVTKYALTTGIMKVHGTPVQTSSGNYDMLDAGRHGYHHGKDWHRDLESAKARVCVMVQAKFKALRKQEAALEVINIHGAKIDDRTVTK